MTDERIRIDKWLHFARFYKTRPLAAKAAESGVVRVNGQRVRKAGSFVKPGDIVTAPLAGQIAAVRIVACGERRGPAVEARLLYESLTETVLDPGAAGH